MTRQLMCFGIAFALSFALSAGMPHAEIIAQKEDINCTGADGRPLSFKGSRAPGDCRLNYKDALVRDARACGLKGDKEQLYADMFVKGHNRYGYKARLVSVHRTSGLTTQYFSSFSIISPHVIIGAAHAFFDQVNKLQPWINPAKYKYYIEYYPKFKDHTNFSDYKKSRIEIFPSETSTRFFQPLWQAEDAKNSDLDIILIKVPDGQSLKSPVTANISLFGLSFEEISAKVNAAKYNGGLEIMATASENWHIKSTGGQSKFETLYSQCDDAKTWRRIKRPIWSNFLAHKCDTGKGASGALVALKGEPLCKNDSPAPIVAAHMGSADGNKWNLATLFSGTVGQQVLQFIAESAKH